MSTTTRSANRRRLPSMGSKILKGERSLTLDHVRRLSEHFKVGPELFIDRPARR